jgi:hypothetical protein
MRKASPWVLAIVFLASVAWIVLSSAQFQNCVEKSKTNAADQNFQGNVAEFYFIFRGCAGGFVHNNAEGIIAVFTVILALSTIFLWGATRDLVQESRDTSRRESRAYIGVEPRGVKRFVGKDLLIGHFAIKNFGGIPAKNVSMYAVTDYRLEPENTREFKIGRIYDSTTSLPPRAKMIFGTGPGVDIDSIQISDDEEANYRGYIFVYGKVTYTDEFGTKGWTEFCHRYPCEGDYRISRKYARYHEIAGNRVD